MEEMMVSRRAVLQSQAEKVSRNWAEESGMRQFVAVRDFFRSGKERRKAFPDVFCVEPDVLETWGVR
jgi:hypothetical protein